MMGISRTISRTSVSVTLVVTVFVLCTVVVFTSVVGLMVVSVLTAVVVLMDVEIFKAVVVLVDMVVLVFVDRPPVIDFVRVICFAFAPSSDVLVLVDLLRVSFAPQKRNPRRILDGVVGVGATGLGKEIDDVDDKRLDALVCAPTARSAGVLVGSGVPVEKGRRRML